MKDKYPEQYHEALENCRMETKNFTGDPTNLIFDAGVKFGQSNPTWFMTDECPDPPGPGKYLGYMYHIDMMTHYYEILEYTPEWGWWSDADNSLVKKLKSVCFIAWTYVPQIDPSRLE